MAAREPEFFKLANEVIDTFIDDGESEVYSSYCKFAPGAMLRAKGADRRERNYTVETVRAHGSRLLVRLSGVADRDGSARADGLHYDLEARYP